MRYRTEHATPQITGVPAVLLWLIGFPGYIILLMSWLGVLGAACFAIAKVFMPANSHPVSHALTTTGGERLPLGAAVTFGIWVGVFLLLAIVYWSSVSFTIRVIQGVADTLETSVQLVKGVGLPLGCGLAAICAMLFRPGLGLQALGIAGVLCGIGWCSFGLEYICGRSLRANAHNK